MLAELAAINAAFAIIKTTVANGSDLAKAGSAIGDFVSAKDALESRHRKKKSSPFGDELQAKRKRANIIETIGIASLCVAFICLFCAFAYWIALKKRWL